MFVYELSGCGFESCYKKKCFFKNCIYFRKVSMFVCFHLPHSCIPLNHNSDEIFLKVLDFYLEISQGVIHKTFSLRFPRLKLATGCSQVLTENHKCTHFYVFYNYAFFFSWVANKFLLSHHCIHHICLKLSQIGSQVLVMDKLWNIPTPQSSTKIFTSQHLKKTLIWLGYKY